VIFDLYLHFSKLEILIKNKYKLIYFQPLVKGFPKGFVLSQLENMKKKFT